MGPIAPAKKTRKPSARHRPVRLGRGRFAWLRAAAVGSAEEEGAGEAVFGGEVGEREPAPTRGAFGEAGEDECVWMRTLSTSSLVKPHNECLARSRELGRGSQRTGSRRGCQLSGDGGVSRSCEDGRGERELTGTTEPSCYEIVRGRLVIRAHRIFLSRRPTRRRRVGLAGRETGPN